MEPGFKYNTCLMDEQALRAEAAALHRALFGDDVPDEIARRYVEAHAHVLTRVTEQEREWMARALGRDLEALEIASRGPNGDHVLTRKMKVLVALCEASPPYYSCFVNDRPRRIRAFAALAWHGIRTAFKSLKGSILKVRGL